MSGDSGSPPLSPVLLRATGAVGMLRVRSILEVENSIAAARRQDQSGVRHAFNHDDYKSAEWQGPMQ